VIPKDHVLVTPCQTVKDAELLVYLVDEEKDIYIGVRPLPPRICPAGHCPAESVSYLGVAESLRTSKWRPHRGLYRTKKDRKKDLDTLPYIPMYGELLKGIRAVSRLTFLHRQESALPLSREIVSLL
jgi:hypothetical protein